MYTELNKKLRNLISEEDCLATNLSNAAALIYEALPDVSWVGFYVLCGDRLCLGPFQGKPACTVISVGKGVCGAVAAKKSSEVVENVHEYSGHIACDCASNSEIVVPVFSEKGELAAVLDIDSTSFSRFTEEDRQGLEKTAAVVGKIWEKAPRLGI